MIHLYVDKNHIKLLALTKTFLSQYNASHFQKTHESDLLEDGKVKNIDLLASAIKEAITLASPKEIKDKDVILILPQQAFEFKRYDVPADISEGAILPFIKDKARAEISFDLDTALFDYFVVKQAEASNVIFYAQNGSDYVAFHEVFKLLGLNLKTVIPDTLCYFKLFEKTLKKDKKEIILYANYEQENQFGYLFDSIGLLNAHKIHFKEPMEEAVKKEVDSLEKKNLKPNRLILAGPLSDSIRQDFFTKNVGVWTNPLKKIINTFYQEYLKLIVVAPTSSFSFMDYSLCLGSFIFSKENDNFSLSQKKNKIKTVSSSSTPSFHVNPRDVVIFLASFALSFAVIYFFPKIQGMFHSTSTKVSMKQNPSPSPVQEPSATPTPSFTKESLNIKVLNGSGTAGKATVVKNILKKAGYGEILTGNADNFDYTKTEIQVKEDKKQAYSMIKTDLADYTTTTVEKALESSSSADVVIIIGTDFK